MNIDHVLVGEMLVDINYHHFSNDGQQIVVAFGGNVSIDEVAEFLVKMRGRKEFVFVSQVIKCKDITEEEWFENNWCLVTYRIDNNYIRE